MGVHTPDPAIVVAELKPVGELLHDGLADGCDHGVQYHETHRFEVIEPWLHACLTRNWATRFIDNGGVTGLGFHRKPPRNASIHLVNEEYEIRVLKVERRRDPLTGMLESSIPLPRSFSRERFFRQPSFDGLIEGATRPLPGMGRPIRLVALWETDSRFQLKSLDLACPKGLTADGDAVDSHWRVPFAGDDLSEEDIAGISPPPPILLEDLDLPPGELAEDA